jgi:general secretion pathway protein I
MAGKQAGFTLLEVLIAIAILGLSLTAILSAQGGAVRAVARARHIDVAVGLLRCKMSEIEEQLRVEGFPELDQEDNGPCCEGDEDGFMTCAWRIERSTFPDPELGKLDLDTTLNPGNIDNFKDPFAGRGEDGTASDLGTLASNLTGDAEGGGIGGVGGIASMIMGLVYPDLKVMLEASTRRVTVEISWPEGKREQSIEIAQWLSKPQPGALADPDTEDAASSGGTATTGTTGDAR